MSYTTRAAIIAAAVLVALMLIYSASASEIGDFYKGLKQPDTGVSCCNISDCKATKAYRFVPETGRWEVLHSWGEWNGSNGSIQRQEWLAVPPNKILSWRQRPAGVDGDEAILCAGRASSNVYCFLPPDLGF